jgi:hypothetical protein
VAKVSASEYAEKLARRLSASLSDMQRGIERVTEAPGGKAAAKQEKMKAKIVAAIDSGKWATAVKSVTLSDWRDKTINVGLARVSTGIEAARPKMEAFAAKLLPYEDSLKAVVDKMADNTLEDGVAKSAAWIRGMGKFKR